MAAAMSASSRQNGGLGAAAGAADKKAATVRPVVLDLTTNDHRLEPSAAANGPANAAGVTASGPLTHQAPASAAKHQAADPLRRMAADRASQPRQSPLRRAKVDTSHTDELEALVGQLDGSYCGLATAGGVAKAMEGMDDEFGFLEPLVRDPYWA